MEENRMDQLQTYRDEIDAIDQQIQELFLKRMEIVSTIADYKMDRDLSVYDHRREDEVIQKNMERIKDSPYAAYYQHLLEVILKESKEFQKAIVIRSTL
jgi:chorismate mutase / prephenate dehydratase